ncbi:hypothetical protein MRX96_031203 [Rhipicephalus microplus]
MAAETLNVACGLNPVNEPGAFANRHLRSQDLRHFSGAYLKFGEITEAEKHLKGHKPAYLLNYSDTPAATAKVGYSKASPLSGSKIHLSATMKIFIAFTLLTILSVLAVLHFASAEEGLDQHHRVSRDAGCPDLKACTKKCQSEGHRTGTCKGISRTRCLCAN